MRLNLASIVTQNNESQLGKQFSPSASCISQIHRNIPSKPRPSNVVDNFIVLRLAQGVCFDSIVGDLLQVSENLAVIAKSQIAQVVSVIAAEHSVDHSLAILGCHSGSGVLDIDDPSSF